jgi:hypothetical protein
MKRHPPSQRALQQATQDGDLTRAPILTRLLPILGALVTLLSTLPDLTETLTQLTAHCLRAEPPPDILWLSLLQLLLSPLLIAYTAALAIGAFSRKGLRWSRAQTSLSRMAQLVSLLPSLLFLSATLALVITASLQPTLAANWPTLAHGWIFLALCLGIAEWGLYAWLRYQHFRRTEAQLRQDLREEKGNMTQNQTVLRDLSQSDLSRIQKE